MKKIIFLFSTLILFSCEEVIDVELNESEPKLVVEATMFRLIENQEGATEIKLSLTAPFFDTVIPTVSDAQVTITDSNNNSFPFTHTSDGRYVSETNLIPKDGVDYTLTILYNGEIYTATEQIESVSPWENDIEQDNEGGFLGDEIEVKAFWTDPVEEENYYYVQIFSEVANELDIASDEFFNGNRIFALFSNEDLQAGDDITFQLDGVDVNFNNFVFILLQQSSDGGGGPFETQPATVRGNILNETNPDNFPLGYFRVSERAIITYTVQ